jgi:hypothetical protein
MIQTTQVALEESGKPSGIRLEYIVTQVFYRKLKFSK